MEQAVGVAVAVAGASGAADNTFPTMPGSYKARLTIAASTGAPLVLERSFTLKRDPMVTLTEAEQRQLYTFRLGLVAFQRTLREKQGLLDSAKAHFAEAKAAAGAAGSKVPDTAKQEIAALDKEFADLTTQVGGGGRGGRGGGGGGGAAGGGRGGVRRVQARPGEQVVRRLQLRATTMIRVRRLLRLRRPFRPALAR